MIIPSLNQIVHNGSRTLRRFPFVLLSAFTGTLSAFILIDYEGPEGPTVLFNILFAAILGIPFLLGIALTSERRKWTMLQSIMAQLIGIVLLSGYAVSVPSALSSAPAFHIQRLLLLAVAAHMWVSAAPYLESGKGEIFWHYNITLLFRFLGAALYSLILYLGLSLALAALDHLFGINIPGKRYGELCVVIVGMLNTWVFLSGIPNDLDSIGQGIEYPKGLRILLQFVLGPLATVYALIIFSYIAKIVFTWEWSEGWIGKLILGFVVTGSFSLLLLFPIRDRDDIGWLRKFSRWFPIVMIPMIIVFPIALWRRVSEFGLTESRYIAFILSAWMVVLVIYVLFNKHGNIKFFPVSLGILSCIICVGPWNVFQISEQSQSNRLQQLLMSDSLLINGHIRKAVSPVSREHSRQINSILDYLHDTHGFERIQPWFSEDLRNDSTGVSLAPKDVSVIAAMMGIEYVRVWPSGGSNVIIFSMDQNASVDVHGFDRMLRLQYIGSGGIKKEIPGENISIVVNDRLDSVTIGGPEKDSRLLMTLQTLTAGLLSEYSNESIGNVPPARLTVTGSTSGLDAKLVVRSIQIRRRSGLTEISTMSIDMFYSLKRPNSNH